MNKYSVAILPRCGLANKLFVWARCLEWSRRNNVEMLPTLWSQLRIGPIIRGEKDFKFYTGLFVSSSISSWIKWITKMLCLKNIHEVEHARFLDDSAGIYIFSELRDHFKGLEDSRTLILDELLRIVKPEIREIYFCTPSPVLGVHIRLGDFVNIQEALSIHWYVEQILFIRKIVSAEIPVTIFSDGHKNQLEEILKIPNVSWFDSGNPLIDLLVMSKSKFLVGNGKSSYFAWASFLGDIPSLSQDGQSLRNWNLHNSDIPRIDASSVESITRIVKDLWKISR